MKLIIKMKEFFLLKTNFETSKMHINLHKKLLHKLIQLQPT